MSPFFLRLLLPAPLGALCFVLFFSIQEHLSGHTSTGLGQDWLLTLLFLSFYGYIFAGLPSLVFALILSLVTRLGGSSPVRLLVAGMIGALSGTLMGLFIGQPLVGTVSGLLVGLLIESLALRLDPPVAKPLAALPPPLSLP